MKKCMFLLVIYFLSTSVFASDCEGQCTPLNQFASPIVNSVGNFNKLMTEVKLVNDTRDIFGEDSPAFLESYGKINIVTKDGKHFSCTGNIVANEAEYGHKISRQNSIVTSAAHCFKKKNLEKIYITFTKRDGRQYTRNLEVLKSSAFFDYAILKMDRPIKTALIEPLIVTTYEIEDIEDIAAMYDEELVTTAGGYSGDIFKGNRGKNLTYDQQCEIKSKQGRYLHTDCITYPGASGGAIVLSGFDDDGVEHNYFMGVLQGSPGDYPKPDRAVFAPADNIVDSLMWEIQKADG